MIRDIERKLKNLTIEKRAFIDGKYVEAVDGKTISKVSSIDGRDIPELSASNSYINVLIIASA